MTQRRDALRSLLAATPQPAAPDSPAAGAPAERVPAGAVRAMGVSLRQLAGELAAPPDGAVVPLDPASIAPSFAADRLGQDEPALAALVESIRQHGQQVPILVRPHPDSPGRYQAAYGHRRIAAASALGIPVKALIRPLSDDELVIAQGKENLERRDLSFIERALFARHLTERGFPRATLQGALGVQPAEMTRYLAVARAVPGELIRAIGPAPRSGRPRWMTLARLVEVPAAPEIIGRLIADPQFAAMGSDARLDRVIAALGEISAAPPRVEICRDSAGRPIARVERLAPGPRLTIDPRENGRFAAWLLERLPGLHAEFAASRKH